MPERRGRRPARRVATATRNFYRGVLAEADATTLADAELADGLVDEVALLRVLVRRQLEGDPENVELVLKSLRLLAQMVGVQYRLSAEDMAALEGTVGQFAEQLATALLAKEEHHGGAP